MTRRALSVHWLPPLLALAAAAGASGAAVRTDKLVVLFPDHIPDLVNNSIDHTPALFGFPQYDSEVVGVLRYDGSSATAADFKACAPGSVPYLNESERQMGVMYMVDRGDCAFVTKVRQVQSSGAVAAIVVNNKPTSQEYNGQLPFMRDDNIDTSITLPSMFISQEHGLKLKKLMLEQGQDVVMSMSWEAPTGQHVVDWEMWTSSNVNFDQWIVFEHTMRDVSKKLRDRIFLIVNYYVIDGSTHCFRNGVNVCGNQCFNSTIYCAVDPEYDTTRGLSGEDVVEENLRRICIFEHLNTTQNQLLWWDYEVEFYDTCGKDELNWRDDARCRLPLMRKLGIDVDYVNKCMKDSWFGTGLLKQNTLLNRMIQMYYDDNVRLVPFISVNDAAYFGGLSCPEPVTRATCGPFDHLCAGFPSDDMPEVCGCPASKPADACGVCGGHNECHSASGRHGGVGVGGVVAIVITLVLIGAGVVFWFVRRQRAQLREDLDGLLRSYLPLEDANRRIDQGKAPHGENTEEYGADEETGAAPSNAPRHVPNPRDALLDPSLEMDD